MCSIHIIGYLQRFEAYTEVRVVYRSEAWVFMSGGDALRDVLNIRAIRERRALPVGTMGGSCRGISVFGGEGSEL